MVILVVIVTSVMIVDGAKEGHYILDRLVRDAVYNMFRGVLESESLSGELEDQLQGIPMKDPARYKASLDQKGVGYLFWPGGDCAWIVEIASSEYAQSGDCTLSAFRLSKRGDRGDSGCGVVGGYNCGDGYSDGDGGVVVE